MYTRRRNRMCVFLECKIGREMCYQLQEEKIQLKEEKNYLLQELDDLKQALILKHWKTMMRK